MNEPVQDPCERIDSIVAATRAAVHVRRVDNLLMIRPEKTLGVNATAIDILEALYARGAPPAREALVPLARRYEVPIDRITNDARNLVEAIRAMMRDDFRPREGVRRASFDRGRIKFPVLAEIALTWACQNRCAFCYAASPIRRDESDVMTTDQVRTVMDRVAHEAHVPSLSFTGGEATLRRDLPELVRHGADLGLRVNLISNGLRAASRDYAATLVDAGLASAQISIEAHEPELHDRLVGRPGAFVDTIAGIRNLRALGIHVHTNTTLSHGNLAHARDIVRFVARDLGLPTMSMNMLIRTGMGLAPDMRPVTYAEIAETLPALLQEARDQKLKLVWYSPVPYCIVNPVLLGQGAKSCACVSGILSIDPVGRVLPCSSFQQGIGSLLHQHYDEIYASRAARYWRDREYLPTPCRACEDADLCGGACPLYWDAAGSFEEIPHAGSSDADAHRAWAARRRDGASWGVPGPRSLPVLQAGEGR